MNIMHIEKPGMFSVIQDTGRYGSQRLGVPVNGPMDEDAHRIGNMLVGNDASAATLECTLTGPTLKFSKNAILALTGADFLVTVADRPVPMNQAFVLRAGVSLQVRERRRGARLYIAVRGGIATKPVLGSRSTFVRGALGGMEGRALRAGDRIPVASGHGATTGLEKLLIQSGTPTVVARAIDLQDDTTDRPLRIMRGPQWRGFETSSRQKLVSTPFSVSNQSDRMGYRMTGAAMTLRQPLEMTSEAVTIGTIQVPPDGNPIILMADRQTAGGYPKIAYVLAADLPRLAQALPGDTLQFRAVSHRQAEQAYLMNEDRMARIGKDAAHALR